MRLPPHRPKDKAVVRPKVFKLAATPRVAAGGIRPERLDLKAPPRAVPSEPLIKTLRT